jgi:hypothetical protein
VAEHAFSTSDPAIVAAFRETVAGGTAAMDRAVADAKTVGKNKGLMVTRSVFAGIQIVGLAPDDPTDPPDGWRAVRGQLEPRRGKPGDGARQWLAAHQPPDLRGVLEKHGLPRHTRMDLEGSDRAMRTPRIFEHDGNVWALYRGAPEGDCTWTPRKISEFHAAQEAFEEADRG